MDVGVVTHGQGQCWYEITLTGFESHAGSTPMPRRRDALLGAARIVEAVNRIALAHPPLAVATVGLIRSEPNSRNVIPGHVFMTAEIRHPDASTLAAMDGELRAAVATAAHQGGLDVALAQIFDSPPVAFDPACVAAVRGAAERLGYRHRNIVAGAGHDACNMARIAPAAMIFTPCVDGISHNEAESISPAWATAGTDVLLQAVVETAGIAD